MPFSRKTGGGSGVRSSRRCFEQAKLALQSDTLLVHYESEKDLTLSCNASLYGVGAVISHRVEGGVEKSIVFASRTLAPAKKDYSQLKKEMLAIVFALELPAE